MSTIRLWKRMNARWVCATARFSSLRLSGMIARRLAFCVVPAPRGRSWPSNAGIGVDRRGLAHLQVAVVGVELRRLRLARPGAVERVQVEARGARLQQLRRRDVLSQHHRGLVERQVVVDELAEVREAGGDAGVPAAAGRHRVGELAPVGLAERGAARPHAREAERRRRRLRGRGQGPRAPVHALAEQPFAKHEVALRSMRLHAATLAGTRRAGQTAWGQKEEEAAAGGARRPLLKCSGPGLLGEEESETWGGELRIPSVESGSWFVNSIMRPARSCPIYGPPVDRGSVTRTPAAGCRA